MRITASGSTVYLKSLAMEDADAIQHNANDPELARDVASSGHFPHPYTRADALEFIQRAVSLYAIMTDLHLGVWEASENELIGACALGSIDLKNKRAEIGYWIGKSRWGKGYGKGAVALMLSYGFKVLELNRVYCSVFESNARSIALLRSLGFVEEGRLRAHDTIDGKRVDSLSFGLLKEEFKHLQNVEISD
ncbi:MAG TPA: GNAT family protein [Candidatus Acidoferrales bacterium]|nr:GNAT family protein [Candidatus Acidoferrales bacterium]